MGVISYRNRNKDLKDTSGKTRKANWEYRFYGATISGKRTIISKCGFSTKQEAVKAGNQAYIEYMNGGSVFIESNMSYSDCLDSWMQNYVTIRCNTTTKEGYERRIQSYIRPELGRYRLTAIKRDSIQSFINSMYHRQFSRNTLSSLLGILSSSLRYAKRQGWIQNNPADDIDLPATRECGNLRKKERDAIPREVLTRILQRFPEGNSCHLPMMLAYHCGMRLGEVFGLAWDDVDLVHGVLYVRQQVQHYEGNADWKLIPPKYNSSRSIRLDDVMWALLRREKERQLQGRKQHGKSYVQLYIDNMGFLNEEKRGIPVQMVTVRENGTYIQPRVTAHLGRVVRLELGYSMFDFHSLRHTHATELSEAGVNIKEIQRRLGHKTLDVTNKRYIHATDIMETQSLGIMNKMYGISDAPDTL